jgi:phage tail-like protein
VPAVSFAVRVGDDELSVARVEGIALAADGEALTFDRPAADQPPRWSAPTVFPRLTLIRALDGDRTLYAWRREAQEGKPAVRDVSIALLSRPGGAEAHRWAALGAWPLAWRGPRLDALEGGLALEALDLVCADLRWLPET